MRQPIGLYLTEFASGEPALAGAAGLPCFDAVAALSEGTVPILDDTDFGAEQSPVPELATDAALDGAEEAPSTALALPPPEPDPNAILDALKADHAAALDAARSEWAERQGAALAAGLAAALAELETRIADTLAPLLEPFLVRAAQMNALAELRAALTTLLGGTDAAIAISGPADLMAALRHGLAERPGLRFAEADGPDVTITLGETRIQSQLAGWARALETHLGAPA